MQTLLLDIRSVHQGRGEGGGGQPYHCSFDALRIGFETFESHVTVTAVGLREGAGGEIERARARAG